MHLVVSYGLLVNDGLPRGLSGPLSDLPSRTCGTAGLTHTVVPAVRVFVVHGVRGSLAKFLTHAFLAPLLCPPFLFTKMEGKETAPLGGLGCMSQNKGF